LWQPPSQLSMHLIFYLRPHDLLNQSRLVYSVLSLDVVENVTDKVHHLFSHFQVHP
jgi:hypothetical protein